MYTLKDKIRNLNLGITVKKFALIAVSALFLGRLQKKIIIMGTTQRLNYTKKLCLTNIVGILSMI